jgi:DNA-binding MarR family transcriptional regulator
MIACMHAIDASADVSSRELAADLTAFMHVMLNPAVGTRWLEVVDEVELSLTQLKVLVALRGDEELSVKQLGAALSLSTAATSRAVDGLFLRGLLERREDEQDRRMKRVRLSAAGRVVLERVAEARIAGIEAFVETLSPAERRGLADGLAPVISRFKPAASPQDGAS